MTEEVSKPDAWIFRHPQFSEVLSFHAITDGDRSLGWLDTPLYSHPPAREAVDDELTEEEWGSIADPESVLYALEIASMGGPYTDTQGNLYGNPRYSSDGFRDAEFRDYGLARAVRVICNNATRILAALQVKP